ncbi:hypothetical protein BUE80_DR011844 [Diplocarpon rosae]|nr:hypothetical protein BUE80_DR011844 [Diplocarpon rosae]
MKFSAIVLLVPAFVGHAYAMFCTNYGISLSNGDFCQGEKDSFCCSRNALKPTGDFKTDRTCSAVKDAYNIDITRYCNGNHVVMCC